jgi:protein-S-isoprenylcysteine O-methyltransferase Ste14
VIALAYGAVCYLAFVATIVYAVGFIGGVAVPKTLDSGVVHGLGETLVVDSALLALFFVQHSVMARPAFKRVWTRVVPASIERSSYVLASSLSLALLFWQWRPLPRPLWSTAGAARTIAFALYGVGWLLVLLSTFMLSHFELFGLTQVWTAFKRRVAASPATLERVWLYRFVRHPMMLGFLIVFWAAPAMSTGHLFFSVAMSGYILVGTRLEERDLEVVLGEAYRTYQREVPMLLPLPRRRR